MWLQLTHIPPRLRITALLVVCVATVNAAPAKLDNAGKTSPFISAAPQYTEDNVETVAAESIGFGAQQQRNQQLLQQQQQPLITSIDSYGNPIESLRPIDTPDGRKVVSAQGLQFEIPNYASGITDIRKPANELLPPYVGEFDIIKQQQHDINALFQLNTNYDNIDNIDESTISTNNIINNDNDNNKNRNERRLNDDNNFNDYNDATDQTDIHDHRFLPDDNDNNNYNNHNNNNNDNNNNQSDDKLQHTSVEKHHNNNNNNNNYNNININHDSVLTATANTTTTSKIIKKNINNQNSNVVYKDQNPQETSTTMHFHTTKSLPTSQIYYYNDDDNNNSNDNSNQLATTTQISILDNNYELGKMSTNLYDDTSVIGVTSRNSIPFKSINSATTSIFTTTTTSTTNQNHINHQHSLYNSKTTKNTLDPSMPTQFSNNKLFSASTYVVPTISTYASPLSSGNFNYPNVPTDITVINRIAAKYQNPFPTTTLDPIAVAEPNQDDDQAFQGTNNLQEQQESVQVLINSASNPIPQYLLDLNDSNIGGPVDYIPTEDESTLKVISWDLVPPGENPQILKSEKTKNIKIMPQAIHERIQDTQTTTNYKVPQTDNPTYNYKETQGDNQIYSTTSNDYEVNKYNKYGQQASTTTPSRTTPYHRRGTIHYTDYTAQSTKSTPRRIISTTSTPPTTRRASTTVRRYPITTTTRRPTTTTTTTTRRTTTTTPQPPPTPSQSNELNMEEYYRLENGDSYTLPPWLAGLDYEDLDVAVTFIVPTDNNEYNHSIATNVVPPLEPFNDLKNINLPAPETENTTPAAKTTTTKVPTTSRTRQPITTTTTRRVTTPTPPRSYWIQTNIPTTTPKPRVSSSPYNNNNNNNNNFNNRFTSNQFAQSGMITTSSTTTTRKPIYKYHTSFNTIQNKGQIPITTTTSTAAPFSQESDAVEPKQPTNSNPFLNPPVRTTSTTTATPTTTTTTTTLAPPESTVDVNENPFDGTLPSWLEGLDIADLGPGVPFNYDPNTLEKNVDADLQAPYQFEEEKPNFLTQSQSQFPSNQISSQNNNNDASSSLNAISAASTISTSKVNAPSSLNTITSTSKDATTDVATTNNFPAPFDDNDANAKTTFTKGEGGKVITNTNSNPVFTPTQAGHSNPFLPNNGASLSASRGVGASNGFTGAGTAQRLAPTVSPRAPVRTTTYRNRFGGPPGILRPYDNARG